MKFKLGIILCLSLIYTLVKADNYIYQYKDRKGNTIISNVPQLNSTKIKLDDKNLYSKHPLKLYPNSSLEANRNLILKEELEHEKQALNDTLLLIENAKLMKVKTNGKNGQASIILMEKEAKEHEKNIQLLTKELKN